ncbi:MAG: hypothetical protein OEZ65_03065 [Gemmatimonadota bacterium]|nr:hypothetical protein [Gemmatimonadota bacterium]MDH5758543.1 hypothetical protein [Gemmatimonadota bacterium]
MTEGEVPVTLRSEGDERPVFWYLTLSAQPAGEHPQPVDQGFTVERWFEDPETGEPVTSAVEGDLVRVKIKVTAPTDREMVVVEDGLPAGLEVVDLSLRTVSPNGPGSSGLESMVPADQRTRFGRWDYGWWSPWDHKEFEDERVIYSATVLWKGTYTMAYLARATTAGSYLYPPTHAEEMYNPGVNGRSGGGTFTVSPKE